jgi:Ca2+-binding EF-hand superfamily protein
MFSSGENPGKEQELLKVMKVIDKEQNGSITKHDIVGFLERFVKNA